MNTLLGTLREGKDQARNTRTTVQENTVPGVQERGEGERLAGAARTHQPLSDEREEEEEDGGHDAVPHQVVVHADHLRAHTVLATQCVAHCKIADTINGFELYDSP